MYAWSKYKKAVIWAFPHRTDELTTYEEHIIGLFNSDFDPLYCIGYDQAAWKFFHENQHSFSQINLLYNISQQTFLPHSGGGGLGRSETRTSEGSGATTSRGGKRKRTGNDSDLPICREFNKSSGCKRSDCRYNHKCSNCYSSSHSDFQCPKKGKEKGQE